MKNVRRGGWMSHPDTHITGDYYYVGDSDRRWVVTQAGILSVTGDLAPQEIADAISSEMTEARSLRLRQIKFSQQYTKDREMRKLVQRHQMFLGLDGEVKFTDIDGVPMLYVGENAGGYFYATIRDGVKLVAYAGDGPAKPKEVAKFGYLGR